MKTREEIANEIIEETSQSVPQIKNYKAGGVFRTFIEVVAAFLEKIYTELDGLLANRFLTTASGEWLDKKAEELCITRYEAVSARGYVIFSREDSSKSVTIAKDKIIATAGGLRYSVLADVELGVGESARSVLVEAENTGSLYNVIGGQITEIITPISGIDSIYNQSDWIVRAGAEEESDDSLRSRCLALWAGLSGANKSAYISWAKSVEGVSDVAVIAEARGLGTVDVVFVGNDNTIPNQDLIDEVQAVVEEHKPIAVNVIVKAPAQIDIDTSLKVVMNTGYSSSKNEIEALVAEFFRTLGIGRDFEPSELISYIFKLEGVKSVNVANDSTVISDLQIANCRDIFVELA